VLYLQEVVCAKILCIKRTFAAVAFADATLQNW